MTEWLNQRGQLEPYLHVQENVLKLMDEILHLTVISSEVLGLEDGGFHGISENSHLAPRPSPRN